LRTLTKKHGAGHFLVTCTLRCQRTLPCWHHIKPPSIYSSNNNCGNCGMLVKTIGYTVN